MTVVADVAALARHVERQNDRIFNSNTSSVRNLVIKTGQQKVDTEVYAFPSSTPRTGQLKELWASETQGGLVAIYNYRSEGGRDIPYVVETGQGYNYPSRYAGVPRPFFEETFNELKGSRGLLNAYKRDLNSALGGMRVV